MQSRQKEDFNAIYWILCSTVRRGTNPKTDPSADHKLKWTLRSASGVQISPKGDPDHESKKEEALQKGIRIIQEFGNASGRWVHVKGQKANPDFLVKIDDLLRENGIQP
jgi:hypothetical protein